jgi:hypothetical protein
MGQGNYGLDKNCKRIMQPYNDWLLQNHDFYDICPLQYLKFQHYRAALTGNEEENCKF